MTFPRIAIVVVLLLLISPISKGQAQELNSVLSADNPAAVVAAQTSSPTNYALLQPISSKPQKSTLGLLQPIQDAPAEKVGRAADEIVVTPHSFKARSFRPT